MRKSLCVIVMVFTLVLFTGAPVCLAQQPHMQAALSALITAKAQLQKAKHNKGGHRLKALQLVNQAIQEVQAGIKAGQ